MVYYVVPANDTKTLEVLRTRIDQDIAPRVRILTYESLYSTQDFCSGTYIFGNFGLATPEQQAYTQLFVSELDKHLEHVSIFNRPGQALGRYELLKSLYENGINEFRPFRVEEQLPDDLRFPVFVRENQAHSGNLSPLLNSREELDTAISALEMKRPNALDDLLVVEYCDTSDESGLFRKYSAFKVGDLIFPRSLRPGHSWMLKANAIGFTDGKSDKIVLERVEEERKYMQSNPHESWLRDVFEIACIQYGRIDYSMKEGKPQVWEINTHPSNLPSGDTSAESIRDELRELRSEFRGAFGENLSVGFRPLLEVTDSPISVDVAAPDSLIRELISQDKRMAAKLRQNKFANSISQWLASHIPDNNLFHPVRKGIGRAIKKTLHWNMRRQ